MKTKLSYEFDSEVDDVADIKIITGALDTDNAIDAYNEWLRSKVKYGCDSKTDWPDELTHHDIPPYDHSVAAHIFQLCRDKLWEFMRDK